MGFFQKIFGLEHTSIEGGVNKQDLAMARYKKRGWIRSQEDSAALHMFFSPTCVPTNMRPEWIWLCIALYPLREKEIDVNRKSPMDYPIPLPRELVGSGRISARKFRAGIEKFRRRTEAL